MEDEDKHCVALTLEPEINQTQGKTLLGTNPEKSEIVSDEILVTNKPGVKEPPVLPLRQPLPQPDGNRQDLLKSFESMKKDASKETCPGPSSILKIVFSKPFKKQRQDFSQEKTETDVMHEEMEKMKREMSRLESVAKDEQRK